ncbi:MAG: PrsW family intramembrane metalloprotease [Patescibacteria group bacterium]
MFILAILLGLVPSFAWLIFFSREDVHPEPKKIIARTFIAGAAITFLAIFFQFYSLKFFRLIGFSEYNFYSFLAAATIEEVFKFLAAYLVIRKSRFFDEPIDAMIYMISAALGFAAMENIFIAFNNIYFSDGGLNGVLGILTLRFVGATLLHALASGIVGYYWAKGFKNISVNIKVSVLKGLILASVLHAIFNYLILSYSGILIIPILFIVIIALFLFRDFEKIKSFVKKPR